jgi:hypothetical protein
MPTTAYTLAVTSTKMRWREPYVTEGLNKKMAAVVPPGVYRGYRLGTHANPLTVNLARDSEYNDHIAVVQLKSGVDLTSLFVRESGSDLTLNFDAPPLGPGIYNGQTVIIALYSTYAVGAPTVTEIRVYTLAEYLALAADVRESLVVLGTVSVPVPVVPIPAADITHDRRREPWEETAPGEVFWSPIIKNSSFEWGVNTENVASTGIAESKEGLIPYWELTIQAMSGSVTLGSSDAYSNFGDRCLLLKTLGGSALTCSARQRVNAPVVPGKLVRVRYYASVLLAAAAGAGAGVVLEFVDKDGVSSGTSSVQMDITVLSGWTKYEGVVEVPANSVYLKSVYFFVGGPASYGGAADVLAIDDVQVWVETGDPLQMFEFMEKIGQPFWADGLVIGKWQTGPTFAQPASLLRFDTTTPVSEGDLVSTSRDEDPAVLPPRFNHKGRLLLGEGLLSALAETLKPRITVNSSDSVVGARTLIYEGQRKNAGTNQRGRLYLTSSAAYADLEYTVNAYWDGANWNKDVLGQYSARYVFSAVFGFVIEVRLNTEDAPWTTWRAVLNGGGSLPSFAGGIAGVTLGDGWYDSAANANKARIFVVRVADGTAVRTRIARLENTGFSSPVNIYRSRSPDAEGETLEIVANGVWNDSTSKWNQSNAAHGTVMLEINAEQIRLRKKKSAGGPWDESGSVTGWDNEITLYVGQLAYNIPYVNTLTQKNIPKSWGRFDINDGVVTYYDGFNFDTVTSPGGNVIRVNFPIGGGMAGVPSYYIVEPHIMDLGTFYHVRCIAIATGYFDLQVYNAAGVAIDPWAGGPYNIHFEVMGPQANV